MTETLETPTRPEFANYLGGAWHPSESGETYENRGPMRPATVLGTFPASGAADVDAAVDAASDAFTSWSGTPAAVRADVLEKAAAELDACREQISQDMVMEMGKPVREARLETARAAQALRFYAGEAWRPRGEIYEQSLSGAPLYTLRRPRGVFGLVTPWNFPLAIPTWKIAPAIVFGNTVVLKPSQEAPLTALHLARCFNNAGIPAGVLNVVTGRGAEVAGPLIDDPRVAGISFTGSLAVGDQLRKRAASLGKSVQLELGGHNPLIVLADADLARAVEAAYAGAFWSAGQKCTSTRRIFVEEGVYEVFKRQLLARMGRGIVGDPTDPRTEVGPIVNGKQLDDVLAAIERGRAEGGSVLAGGDRIDEESFLLAPTLFDQVSDGGFLSREEVFGPVVALYPFSVLDDAIERANATRFGLSAGIFTTDARAIRQFVGGLDAGILHVNQQTAGAEVHVPFGGLKGSGYGPHEQGRAAIEFYTDTVTVYDDS